MRQTSQTQNLATRLRLAKSSISGLLEATARIIVAKILPAHAPDNRFYQDIKATNEALDKLKLNSDPQVQVLDLTQDFVNDDGTLKKDLYTPDNIHLSPPGYAVYAARLKPMINRRQ